MSRLEDDYRKAWSLIVERPMIGRSREQAWAQDGTLAMNVSHLIEDLKDMAERLKAAEQDSAELNQLFELQYRRMGEATAAWREANPGNDHCLPDLGELLAWLLSQRRGVGEAQ